MRQVSCAFTRPNASGEHLRALVTARVTNHTSPNTLISSVVGDNGKNFAKAARLLCNDSLACFAHTIQLAINDATGFMNDDVAAVQVVVLCFVTLPGHCLTLPQVYAGRTVALVISTPWEASYVHTRCCHTLEQQVPHAEESIAPSANDREDGCRAVFG